MKPQRAKLLRPKPKRIDLVQQQEFRETVKWLLATETARNDPHSIRNYKKRGL